MPLEVFKSPISRKRYIGRRSERGKRAISITYNTYREHASCLLLLFGVYILLNCFSFKTAYLLKWVISFGDKSNQLLLSLLNDYIEGLQNIGSRRIRLRLSNLKDLPRFGLDYIRDKSNISFLISSRLNYSGTLNSLVAYSNTKFQTPLYRNYQIIDAFVL